MLAYYYPPVGGGGTLRSAEFARLLPTFGYNVTVFTAELQEAVFRREFTRDLSYAQSHGGGEGPRVVRAFVGFFGRAIVRVRESRAKALAWALAYPWLYEAEVSWADATAREVIKQFEEGERYEIVYASAPPHSSMVAAARVARKLHLPWVADLRDLWTRDTIEYYPTRLHYLWASSLEKRTLESASAIIANTALSGERLQSWLSKSAAARVCVIPNGFDSRDAPLDRSLGASQSADVFTIAHVGTLYSPGASERRLGRYRPAMLDNTARSILPLAKALRLLREQDAGLAARVKVRLLGFVSDESRRCVADLGLTDQIVMEGVLPRGEALGAMNSADALLVAQVAWEDPFRPMPYIPGKVYEYLATGKPILAPTGPGDLRDLLSKAPQAYVCDYRDDHEICATLRRLYADSVNGNVQPCQPDWLGQFSRRNLTERLARVFDHCLSERSPAVHWQ